MNTEPLPPVPPAALVSHMSCIAGSETRAGCWHTRDCAHPLVIRGGERRGSVFICGLRSDAACTPRYAPSSPSWRAPACARCASRPARARRRWRWSLAAEPGLRCWSHIDERSAAFFALGLAEATRRPAAVVCTSGTAAANFFPAVDRGGAGARAAARCSPPTARRAARLRRLPGDRSAQALRRPRQVVLRGRRPGRRPALLPQPRPPRRRRRCRRARRAGAPQLPLPRAAAARRRSARAIAADDRRRPRRTLASAVTVQRSPDAATLDALAERLAAAPRGVIVCGPLDADGADRAALAALAARSATRCSPMPPPAARRRATTASAGDHAYDALLRDADAGRAPGAGSWCCASGRCRSPSRCCSGCATAPPTRSSSIPTAAGTTRCTAPSACCMPTSRRCATALAARVCVAPPTRDWLRRLARCRAARPRRARRRAGGSSTSPSRAASLRRLGATRCRPARRCASATAWRCAISNLLARRRVAPRARAVQPRRQRYRRLRLHARSASPPRAPAPTVALTGDLGFLHDLNGLLAARRHGVRAIFVVCNNDGGGIFSYLPQADGGAAFARILPHPARPRPARRRRDVRLRLHAAPPRERRSPRRSTRRSRRRASSHRGADRPDAQRRAAPRALGGRRRAARAADCDRRDAAASSPVNGVRYARARVGPRSAAGAAARLHRQRARCGRRTPRALARRFRVIAVDLLGHGASDAPADARAAMRMARHVDDLAALLDGSAIERAACSATRWAAASRWPSPLEHPRARRRAGPGERLARHRRRGRARRARRRRCDARRRASSATASPPSSTPGWRSRCSPARRASPRRARRGARAAAGATRRSAWPTALRGLGTGAQPSYWQRLHELAMPTLLLAGALDDKFQAPGRAPCATAMPGATLRIIADAGHADPPRAAGRVSRADCRAFREKGEGIFDLRRTGRSRAGSRAAGCRQRAARADHVRTPPDPLQKEGITHDHRMATAPHLHRHPLRERRTASPRSPSTGPRCATPSGRRP